jgi:hypothetical protein
MSERLVWSAVYGAYAGRLRFPLAATASFVLLVPGVLGLLAGEDGSRAYCAFAGTLVLMTWTGLVSGHLKEVLARPQARLLPGYPRVQVLAGGGLVLPLSILSAFLLWTVGFDALPAIAVVLVATGLYWAGPYLLNHGNNLLVAGLPLLLVAENLAERGVWSRVNPGWPEETWSVAAIVISSVLIGFTAHRMLHVSESSFEYHRDPSTGWNPGRPYDQEEVPFRGVFDRVRPWLGRYRRSPSGSRFGAGFWSRVQLWRMGMSRTSPAVTGALLAGMIALIGALSTMNPENRPDPQAALLVFCLMFFSLGGTTYVHRRKERMQFEAVYPASREGILRELGAASALDIVETWLFLCLGTLAARGLGLFPEMSWATLLSYIAYTLGPTILGIGLVPWALRLQTEWACQLILIVGTLALAVPVAFTLTKGPGTEAVAEWAAAGAVLAAIGVGLGYAGYRTWCRLELGRTDLGSG